jgi:hypothetical protein
LQKFREVGQQPLDELPQAEFADWDKRARLWDAVLEAFFARSPHLGKAEAQQLTLGGWVESRSPEDSASEAIAHRIERIDVNLERFAGN